MEEYRCRSYADGRMEIERYTYNNNNNNGGNNNQSQKPSNFTNYNDYDDDNNNNSNGNFNGVTRSYSASYATTAKAVGGGGGGGGEPKELRKYKRANGSFSCFGDPEMQRKRRVASYRGYSVEAKLKKSFSKSFKWIKDRYSRVVHGD